MVDRIKTGGKAVVGKAATAKRQTDKASAPVVSVEAGPAANPVAETAIALSGETNPAQAATPTKPAVEPVVVAKVAERVRPVRKARPATAPVAAPTTPARPAPAPAMKQTPPEPTLPEPTKAAPAPVTPTARTATAPTKDKRTMTTTTIDMTEKFQTAIKDASEKAKAAFEKSQASFGEIGEFTKGNVEALVEASKILASGLQEMSKGYMTGSKSTLETLTAEMKELAAVKTPSELLEKQSTLLRKHFDAAVAASSKNSEAMLKLASEAFQPISNRVSLAVEKVKHAA